MEIENPLKQAYIALIAQFPISEPHKLDRYIKRYTRIQYC